MQTAEQIHQNWLESAYGRSFLNAERIYTDKALRQIVGPRVLQVGNVIDDEHLQDLDFPQLIEVHHTCFELDGSLARANTTHVLADAAFLPFAADSLSSVILPHVLENHQFPHQVLREAHRVVRPEGYLLLTGFNPFSVLGLQRWLYPRASYQGHYYAVKRVKDWLQLLGFEVLSSAMYQYAPLCKSSRLRKAVDFLNSAGDRWLPMTGGGYMISAKKREVGMRLVGRVQFSPNPRRPRKLSTATPTAHSSTNFISNGVCKNEK